MIKIVNNPSLEEWTKLIQRPTLETKNLSEFIETLFKEVEEKGDIAIREYAQQFEGIVRVDFRVSESEVAAAKAKCPIELQTAIKTAACNIEKFHSISQSMTETIETTSGVWCSRKTLPIKRVGLYIPGGTAPLFSTVLMLALPARLAGCGEIVLCSPPSKDGKIHPAVLFAADIAGVKEIYQLGGAQAIAALAIGTETVRRVDKIFGPGNQYVTAAKQYASSKWCAIDMPAGPSELLIIADETANPDFVAADLLSQAEHGVDSQVVLISNSPLLAERVQQALTQQIITLPRADIARKALESSLIILFDELKTALDFSNAYCPEHLILATEQAQQQAEFVTNAGSVFIGHFSPESVGDYASGTNHTLPTAGFARAFSGLSTASFMKTITFQELSQQGLLNLASVVETMAEAELLQGHASAVNVRKNFILSNFRNGDQ